MWSHRRAYFARVTKVCPKCAPDIPTEGTPGMPSVGVVSFGPEDGSAGGGPSGRDDGVIRKRPAGVCAAIVSDETTLAQVGHQHAHHDGGAHQ